MNASKPGLSPRCGWTQCRINSRLCVRTFGVCFFDCRQSTASRGCGCGLRLQLALFDLTILELCPTKCWPSDLAGSGLHLHCILQGCSAVSAVLGVSSRRTPMSSLPNHSWGLNWAVPVGGGTDETENENDATVPNPWMLRSLIKVRAAGACQLSAHGHSSCSAVMPGTAQGSPHWNLETDRVDRANFREPRPRKALSGEVRWCGGRGVGVQRPQTGHQGPICWSGTS
ncbi:hypothetical protein B0H66DRAFT_528178 [Apodospora peruviana]|uniref:Uncharacterized protein n=1 Tax=Apodospora peruviana TaxID=516989 RepID=A0AAE0IT66_9PEZI|nr:hypothetical protein B0H66DRAFT_528178 [Apodospora peruviana]